MPPSIPPGHPSRFGLAETGVPTATDLRSQPLTLAAPVTTKVYGLFAAALGLTALGVYVGTLFAPTLFRSGIHLVLLIAELGIVLTARIWMEKSPWNVLLFGLFPLLSGITITPYLWYVSTSVANGNVILGNALIATTLMVAAAALFARTTSLSLAPFGRFLFLSVLGLIGFGILQLFVPALRQSLGFEMGLSAMGVIVFAAFTAYDFQRIEELARSGASPFMLALNLYLDIFNLFLYILRFMVAISGNRR